jgi:uncharacterized protein (DUF1810 family)
VSSRIKGRNEALLWWGGYLSSKNRFYHANELVLDLISDPAGFKGKYPYLRSRTARFLVLAKSFYYFLKVIRRVCLAGIYEGWKVQSLTDRSLYVLTTFSYEKDFNGSSLYSDSFWGDLPKSYKKKNIDFIYFTFPLLSSSEYFDKSQETSNLISFYAFLDFWDLIKIFKILFLSKLNINLKDIFVGTNNVSVEMSNIIDYDIKSAASVNSLVLYYACKKFETKDVKKYFYIYEGNYWERLQLLALKEFSPATTVIGYQHNVVSRAAFNYFPSEGDIGLAPMPDKVLTTGPITAERLKTFGNYGELPVISTCAIRYGSLFNLKRVTRTQEKVLLVALEGLRQSVEMINSLEVFVDQFPDWKVRVRTHPIFPIREVRKYLTFNIDNIDNIEICENNVIEICDVSQQSIFEDIIEECSNKNIRQSCLLITNINNSGYSCDDIIDMLFDFVKKTQKIEEIVKIKYIKEISLVGLFSNEGYTTITQLYGLLARFCMITNEII